MQKHTLPAAGSAVTCRQAALGRETSQDAPRAAAMVCAHTPDWLPAAGLRLEGMAARPTGAGRGARLTLRQLEDVLHAVDDAQRARGLDLADVAGVEPAVLLQHLVRLVLRGEVFGCVL